MNPILFLSRAGGLGCILLIATTRLYADVDPNFHLFLFIGQSNMAAINTVETEDMVFASIH